MSIKTLRDYQSQAVSDIVQAIIKGNRDIYVKIGCGGGKTFLTKSIIDRFRQQKPNLKTFFVVPKNILIKQTVDEFGEGGIYNAGLKQKDLSQSITVGSVQSMASIYSVPKVDVLFLDECHRAKRQHEQLVAKIRTENPRAIIIGLTATDYVMNEKLNLKKVCDFSLKYLTKRGYLAPLVVFSGHEKLDVSKMRPRGESYNPADIREQVEEKVEKQVMDMLRATVNRKKVIIICTTIKHAEQVALLIGDCQLYHSKLSHIIRENNLDEWKQEGKYLVSVIAASEGFDHPPSDCLVFFRPTRSATLYEQACGRVARLSPGKKNGMILDYGGVIDSLGLPYDIEPVKKNQKVYRECPNCDAVNPVAAVNCDACGMVFLVECGICKKEKPFGVQCCERVVDVYKNLTETAYTKKSPWTELHKLTVSKHISRKGKICLRVDWWETDFKIVCTEYHSFKSEDFRRFSNAIYGIAPANIMSLLTAKQKKIPYKIIVKKIEGYKRVTSMSFIDYSSSSSSSS